MDFLSDTPIETPRQTRTPNPAQAAVIFADVNENQRVLAGPGAGKCLAPGTPVMLFSGEIVAVEDIRVGDQLMGDDGTPRNVLSLAHGYEQMYRITPTKGDAYIVNESHILSLKVSGNEFAPRTKSPRYGGDGTVVNISVYEYLLSSNRFRHHLKGWRTGIDFDDAPVSIDPYFVGLWLGDGHSHTTSITTADPEIVEYLTNLANEYGLVVRKDGHREYIYHLTTGEKNGPRGRNILRNQMNDYGLLNNKHIPVDYLKNNRSVRLSVLAGLIDSDGYLHKGCVEIAQKSERLTNDILFLARSLGFAAYSSDKFINGEKYYRIIISGDLSTVPTIVKRKIASIRLQKKDVLRVGITVTPVGYGEYYGFEIDGNHLFLLGDFTVTHNTFTIALRYAELVDSGISPDNIVAVTYSASMAKELLERIAATVELTDQAARQICTIHALCYRILRAENVRRDVPKEWQQKQILNDIAEELWSNPSQRPAWRELLAWINMPKSRGITSADDGKFYSKLVSDFTATLLHKARAQYDLRMASNNWIDFATMIFDVEQRLIRDRDFRVKYQTRFSHIIVDESQDTSAQALRILMTLSLDPGDNRVYSGWRAI